MQRRLTVRGIVVKDGRLLCCRLTPYRHKDASTFWCTLGGGVDDGEALIPALKREMLEETGIPAKVGRLLYIQQYADKVEEQLEFFFEVTNADDYKNIDLSKSSHGTTEIEEIGFVDPKTTHILPKFLTEQPIQEDIKNSQSTRIFNYLLTGSRIKNTPLKN